MNEAYMDVLLTNMTHTKLQYCKMSQTKFKLLKIFRLTLKKNTLSTMQIVKHKPNQYENKANNN